MSMPGVTKREAYLAVKAAARYLEWPRKDPARALALLAPYAECEEFTDATPREQQMMRSIVCAVFGDCFRAMGEVKTAADWYLRGWGNSQAAGSPPFFASCYALMVVDERLADHYAPALDALRASEASWRSKPLLVRLLCHAASMWWLRPAHWRLRLRERGLVRELEGLIQNGTGPT
jgi:hypothetical protein